MRRGLSRGVRAAALAAVAGAGFSVHAANEIRVIVTFNDVQQQSFTVDSGAPITVNLGTPGAWHWFRQILDPCHFYEDLLEVKRGVSFFYPSVGRCR
ncbi:MAG: hypothetical protein K2X32_00235, partial [Phycisphaerales bacterium]|nr:hypothetical protein [Phycisphaerales bacterium]